MGGSPPYGVVIKTQPPVSIVKPGMAAHPLNDHFLTLSIVLSVICFMCGTWYSLFCTVPAIIIATSVREDWIDSIIVMHDTYIVYTVCGDSQYV